MYSVSTLQINHNPPYSIKQWDREAFASDKYGRNFLGIPPQGRADYAFFQHILKSMDGRTGRCAILFPHGILFRDEEYEMRKKLVDMDLVECVIGIGKNLFFNSPMEACIVICKNNKQYNKGKVLFINAKDEVMRKNSQSYLNDENIHKIANAYSTYKDIDKFAKVVDIKEIASNGYKLSIPLYVFTDIGELKHTNNVGFDDSLSEWIEASNETQESFNLLNEFLSGGDGSAKI